MPRFKFDKLVRDKIVGSIIGSGATAKYITLSDSELKKELVNKIIEEAKEISNADKADIASEIADVQQAIDDLIELYDLKTEDINKAKKAKLDKAGAFKKGHYIYYVDAGEDNKWVKYYRENADRYPEM